MFHSTHGNLGNANRIFWSNGKRPLFYTLNDIFVPPKTIGINQFPGMNCNDVVLPTMPRVLGENHVFGNCNGVLLN